MTSEENYYKILAYLDERVKFDSDIGAEALKDFKATIRDNKYVSTYIRSLKLKLEPYKKIDDFIKAMDKHTMTKTIDDVVEYEVRQMLDSIWEYHPGVDPMKIIHYIIDNAIEREGKICDFRDSIHPNKITGSCQGEDHREFVEDDPGFYLSDDEVEEYNKICEEDDSDKAYEKFIDKFEPEEELELTLFPDMDINKFDDNETQYVCSKCMKNIRDNPGDCEVSCDMG